MKQSATERAITYLAQREHSQVELENKLFKAGYDEAEIQKALTNLQEANLQSDSRYVENYIISRSSRGYGELKIRMELKHRGVASNIIDDCMEMVEINWFALAEKARCKRFGEAKPDDVKSRSKQYRFLQYRGFTHEQITESFIINNEN